MRDGVAGRRQDRQGSKLEDERRVVLQMRVDRVGFVVDAGDERGRRVHVDLGGDGGDHGEQAELFRVAELVERRDVLGRQRDAVDHLLVVGRLAEAVAALVGDLERVVPQAGIVGDEEERLLARRRAARRSLPAHEPPDGLAEEQLGRRGRGEHPDAQPRDVDALGHHAHRDDPRSCRMGERRDARRRVGVVGGDDVGVGAEPVAHQAGDALGVFLVGGDHQAGGVGLVDPDALEALVGGAQRLRNPVAFQRQRGAQALRRLLRGQAVLERGRDDRTVGRRPFHQPVDAREVHRSHDGAVAQRVGVAVLVVGHGLVEHVAHERDRLRVRAERCARDAEPAVGAVEGGADRGAPRLVVAGVVDLVEHDERVRCQRGERLGRGPGGHLLERGHDAVHVRRQTAFARGPLVVEVKAEPRGGGGPLQLEVGRRRHDHQSAGALGHDRAGAGEGERGLACAWCGDGQEVARLGSQELLERGALPGAEADRAGHVPVV